MAQESEVSPIRWFNTFSNLFIGVSIFIIIRGAFGGLFGGIIPLWTKIFLCFVLIVLIFKKRIRSVISQIYEGKISKQKVLQLSAKLIILLAVTITLVSLWHYYSYQKYLQRIFVEFFPRTPVNKVKLIDGRYFAWLDWNASLDFSTDIETFDGMVKDYDIITQNNVIGRYFNNVLKNNPNAVFYYKDIPRREQNCEEYIIAWDKKENKAYFQAKNSNYIEFLSAKMDIPAGTVVTQDMIEMKNTTFTRLGTLAISYNAKEPVGKMATRDIAKGEQINDFVFTENESWKPEGIVKKYSNGKLKYEKLYHNGVLDGVTKEYYDTGELKYEYNYVNGKQEGLTREFAKEGKVKGQWIYKEGKYTPLQQ